MASKGSTLGHQIQDAVLGLADGLFAKADLILEGAILLVGLGAEHLVLQLGDLLILDLDIVVELLAFFLIGSQGGTIGLQPPQMRIQRLFDLGDMFWKGGYFPLQLSNLQIQRLQAGDLLHVRGHLISYFSISVPRSMARTPSGKGELVCPTSQHEARLANHEFVF